MIISGGSAPNQIVFKCLTRVFIALLVWNDPLLLQGGATVVRDIGKVGTVSRLQFDHPLIRLLILLI